MADARIVLTTLMDEKLLEAGPKRLYVSYYRKRVYADLLPDGSIRYKNEVYTSPVPCALHMKRTLNPSLKTDAGWSSMYSAASGESLKDIKDRLNIRKRGTNARSVSKERKAAPPSLTVKERVAQLTAALATQKAVPKCSACRKEATTDVVECSACHSKTHWKCASPALKTAGPKLWFCEKCVTGQANRILEFLQQTRRVLVERIAEQREAKEKATTAVATKTIEAKHDSSDANDDDPSTHVVESAEDVVGVEKEEEVEAVAVVSTDMSKNDQPSESSHDSVSAADAECSVEPMAERSADSEKQPSDDSTVDAVCVAEVDALSEPMAERSADSEKQPSEDSTVDAVCVAEVDASSEPMAERSTDSEKQPSEDSTVDAVCVAEVDASSEPKTTAFDAVVEEETKQTHIDVIADVPVLEEVGHVASESKKNDDDVEDAIVETAQVAVSRTEETTSAEEDFLVLVDSLIAEVSSKDDRASLIANSTGATLVHLEKTHLVQLVEYGKRKVLAANQLDSGDDSERDGAEECDQDITASRDTSEVGALIKIFDLRHQILSSQSQFQRTTNALAKRTEKHMRNAETEVMELEESRTVETTSMTKMVDAIDQHASDLSTCGEKIYYDEVLLESINRRRQYIRSTNIKDRFVPSYRHSTKLMTTSSDQLLLTVLLEKLRDITEVLNEWTKMERHFVGMTSSLNKSLSLIGTKRKCTGGGVKFLPTVPLFAQVGIPPSRRLIERQIANFKTNLNTIRQDRVRMRQTLSGILKIAREEHLSDEVVKTADMLYQKCRDVKAEAEEEQLRLKEEAEAVAKEYEDEQTGYSLPSANDDDASGGEPELKKQCLDLDQADSRSDSLSDVDSNAASAISAMHATPPSDKKGISSLLGTDDSDEKDSNYSCAASKACVDENDGSEEDLEQASRAIADISSVLPDLSGGGDPRTDLLNPLLTTEKPGLDASRGFASPGQFVLPDRKGSSDKCNSHARQAIDPQQHNQPAMRFSGRSQQSFSDQGFDVPSEQQLRPELQHQERERLERLRIEEQCQEQERQEQERRELQQQRLEREHQRLEQKRHEQQQRMEKQRCLEEQHRLKQQRLEQHHMEQQQQQQLLEQQCQEEQRQQELERQRHQRQEQQRQEQQQQQRLEELRRRQQQEQQQRQEQERHFQHGKSTGLPQVVPPGASHLQMLSQQQQQQQQQLQQQQAAALQQQHSRQLQHPLYGDIPKGILMSSGMGTASQQDVYAQQAAAAQMGINMHDVVRHQDSSHYVGSTASGSLRAAHYMASGEASRSAVQKPPSGVPRTSFYGDDGQGGQLHAQDVFGPQLMSTAQRQFPDHHHMFASELQQQQQQSDPPRATTGQEFLLSRSYRGLSDSMQQHPGLNPPDDNDVNMGDWPQ
ncbi:unnamed protein product [Hyaloperonospora brassicae]|uniref:Zinc finger PHD-type domain-containing protein n=1 Tax=Hyaloperonospora brassicae TaxID=162125 RepID=A0AAV0UGV0_HYABA|nr:unnamed protein product [Hyaloperonospora brassicae]